MTPIPVHILTGFLGAGKTTFLNRLLGDPAFSGTAVIVNEFGSVGLDHRLVRSVAGDRVMELSGGCLCCTMRSDLSETLEALQAAVDDRTMPIRRVVVETTGLAEPGPVAASILSAEEPYRLGAIVTLIDAVHGAATLRSHGEARHQAAAADLLLLSKAGQMTDADEQAQLQAALAEHVGPRPLREVSIEPAALLAEMEGDGFVRAGEAVGGSLALKPHRHGAYVSTHLSSPSPMPAHAMAGFLEIAAGTFGPHLLRMKGLAAIEGQVDPLLVQMVAGRYEAHAYKIEEVAAPAISLVAIAADRALLARLEDLFAAFAGHASIDRPDRAALTDNPLAIPGF